MMRLFLLVLFFCVTGVALRAQQSVGTINGRVHLSREDDNREVVALAEEVTTEATLETSEVDTAGAFSIHNVPFATYDVYILNQGKRVLSKRVVVHSTIPVTVTFDTLPSASSTEIVVTDNHLESTQPAIHTLITAPIIQSLPVTNPANAMEAILLNSPGVVPDEDGRFHMRGEDAMLGYVIDGIPITTNQTRIYTPLFNARLIESADLLRGSLDPEYGVAASGIMNISTKSGYDKQSFGSAQYAIGSFNNHFESVDFGGNFTQAFAFYGSYGDFRSDRYLDPVSGFDPNHTAGSGSDYFGKINVIASDKLDITALGFYNKAAYQVPNQTGTVVQDQNQNLSSYMFGARVNYSLSSSSVLSVLGYTRAQQADLTSNGLDQIRSSADSSFAVAHNDRYFIGAHRKNAETGGQIDYSIKNDWMGGDNEVKFGVGGEVFPLSEFLTFAVTNPNVSDSTYPGGDSRFIPYDLTKGGHPFLVDTAATGKRYSGYIQDRLTRDDWTFSGGLRFDIYDLLQKESGLSPRLNVVFRATDDLLLRASYNRMFMQAPIENILVSSSAEAGKLVAGNQGATPRTVKSEKSHVFEIGAGYRLSKYISLDLTGYGKLIDDFVVKVELGNSGVIFPANINQGRVFGGDLSILLRDWNNFSGELSFSTISSKGVVPSDGSSPFSAGLVLGEEGENYSHPFAGEDMFNTEHNQLFTSSFNVRYDSPIGIFAVLSGRYDSGLPFDLIDPKTGKGPDEARSREILLQRGYTNSIIDLLNLASDLPGSPDKHVAGHATFDASAGYDLAHVGLPIKLTGSVINFLNTQYLYKFESTFSGTHFGSPRMFLLRAQLTY